MTDTNAPDVGMLRESMRRLKMLARPGDMPDLMIVQRGIDRLEEQLAQARGGLADAYDAGFMASGEGWNGEHGGDTDSRHYLKRRAEYFAALATQTGATHES